MSSPQLPNNTLVPTRKGEAPSLAAQRGRYTATANSSATVGVSKMKSAAITLSRCLLLVSLLIMSLPAAACTQDEAFGFKFGEPVPARAKDVKEFYFMGGTGEGNVLRSFQAPVPAPMGNFPDYAYWSNRDRRVVNSIVAFRQLISDKELLNDEAYRTSVLEKTKVEIAQLREAWERKYGIIYTAASQSELTWDGENAYVSSTIGTFGGEYIYIECTNKALRQKAEELAWKGWLKK